MVNADPLYDLINNSRIRIPLFKVKLYNFSATRFSRLFITSHL